MGKWYNVTYIIFLVLGMGSYLRLMHGQIYKILILKMSLFLVISKKKKKSLINLPNILVLYNMLNNTYNTMRKWGNIRSFF